MRNVVVLIHDDDGEDSRVQAALDLTRALRGHLSCLVIAMPVTSMEESGLSAQTIERATRRNAAAIRHRIETSGVPFDWIDRVGELATVSRSVADMADVMVLSTPGHLLFPDMRKAIGDVLVRTNKPILAVPASASGLRVKGEALILWDGSVQATAAMHASMPLLRLATTVTLLEIDDGSLNTPARRAAEHLSECGIRVHVVSDLAFGMKAGFAILDRIALLKPDYVVMGGFGRSRFIEGIFGGVTERLLRDSPVPLFLKH